MHIFTTLPSKLDGIMLNKANVILEAERSIIFMLSEAYHIHLDLAILLKKVVLTKDKLNNFELITYIR